MTRKSVRARLISGLCAVVVLVLVIVAGASAAGPTYTVAFSPSSVHAGTTTFTAQITNGVQTEDIRSADLAPPSGFTVSSASLPAGADGTAAVVNNNLQLRNLDIDFGQSLAVTLRATTAPASCANRTFSWAVGAKPDPNFAGPAFTLDAAQSNLHTTVKSEPCKLEFSVEPHNAVAGKHITGSDYSTSGPPVTVRIVDLSNHVVTTSSASVAVALGKNLGGATLAGTKTVNAVDGVAKFSGLTLNNSADGYTLTASSPRASGTTSTAFDIQQVATTCAQGSSCHTNLKNAQTDAFVEAAARRHHAGAGVLAESLNTGPALTCGHASLLGRDWVAFDSTTTNRSKRISLTVKNAGSDKRTGSGDLEDTHMPVCFGAPYKFKTASGKTAHLKRYRDGFSEYVGLLPNCPAAGPCVTKRVDNDNSETTTAEAFVPAGLPGDPRMR